MEALVAVAAFLVLGNIRTIVFTELCRPCLDWSERRPHLAGRVGAALCVHGLDRGWIRKRAGSRALEITPEGRRAYHDRFHVELNEDQ
jgi:hypothetical protein